ncbi:MAG: substrate-binding domain-containing protein [Candidatus Eremiobacteraeota bacterium]|nr:substrate-binding domain-containing protein [Candidatus Eremiobacteraeota bacterium]
MNIARRSAIVAVLALAACSSHGASKSGSTASGGSATSAPTKTIGVSIQNREAQFYQEMEAGMSAEAKKYGYALNVVDANRDNARQQSQVEDFISKHVNAIVLTPYDSKAIGSAIVEANRAKIPVFTADIASTSKQGVVVAHIASDNVAGGMEAGKLICKAIGGSGEVAIVDEPEVTSVQDRVRGFKAYLAKSCTKAKIVADVDAGGQRDKAANDVGDILQTHPHLRGIFGINDDSALGALTAVRAAGMAGKVAIVGFDATPEARTAIAKGEMYGDVVQHPQEIGKMVIDTLHGYFAGTMPPKVVKVPVGTYTAADAKKAP